MREVSIVGLLVLLVACGGGEEPETAGAASAETALRLRVFDCGHFRIDNLEIFSLSAEEVATPELFVPCYLIEHSNGKLIWDAGLPPSVLAEPGGVPVEGMGWMHYDTSLAAQLQALGLRPSDVTHVAFSHMHYDHVGSANLFTDAVLLIQKPEYEAAFARPPTVEFFDRSLYGKLESNETALLAGDHDVFGDGRVMIVSAPGHTPGHQVLFVDLETTGPIVLSGDLYHFPESYKLRRVPTFNFDREQTLASMARVDAFLEEKGAALWIEHDLDFARGLRKSPGFYE